MPAPSPLTPPGHDPQGSDEPVPAPPPWSHQIGVDAVVRRWLSERSVIECVTDNRVLEPRQAEHAPLPEGLEPRLVQALSGRGIQRLYSHQHEAVTASLSGQHVVTATPTASGKSLCLHLPVLDALARDETASALYLYPTKALSRDQEQGLHSLIRDAGLGIPALVYDGDTPGDARRVARNQSRLVLTNPDMLHASILPNHARWARVFQNLRYVVIDELHVYRGVFGSHMAHVIARLARVAAFHGSQPRFVMATATIGNPREHASRLLGVDPERVHVVSRTGAPSAGRQVFLYNPPLVNAELGIRASSLKHAVRLSVDLLAARVPTIIFAGSRSSVEVMLKYVREKSPGVPADAIFGYRGGYLPDRRRAIERGLREGTVRCVVATSALELGIDIGDLDAVVCVGYPGSVAATWQRFGRAGRRDAKSIAVMVLNSRATDQFMAHHPDYVLDADAEEARIDPDNVEIVLQHLKCAAFESPFRLAAPRLAAPRLAASRPTASRLVGTHEPAPAETGSREQPGLATGYAGLDPESTRQALDYLGSQGLLHFGGGQYSWTGDTSPAAHVSLRSISWDNFVIVDVEHGRTLAELDWRSTHTMLHEQAIYQHDAAQYQVERLDYENHKAYVRRVEPDYFTTALTHSRVTVLESAAERSTRAGYLGQGDIKVVETVTGYKKIKFHTHENAGYGDVHLPDVEMHTTGFWWTLPPTIGSAACSRALVIDALRGAGAALETVSCIALMCEPQDIGRTLGGDDSQPGGGSASGPTEEIRSAGTGAAGADAHRPTLFLFDGLPGGVGLARRIFERSSELMGKAASLIEHCPCPFGCPACVGASIADAGSSWGGGGAIVGDRRARPAAVAQSGRKALASVLLRGGLDPETVARSPDGS